MYSFAYHVSLCLLCFVHTNKSLSPQPPLCSAAIPPLLLIKGWACDLPQPPASSEEMTTVSAGSLCCVIDIDWVSVAVIDKYTSRQQPTPAATTFVWEQRMHSDASQREATELRWGCGFIAACISSHRNTHNMGFCLGWRYSQHWP